MKNRLRTTIPPIPNSQCPIPSFQGSRLCLGTVQFGMNYGIGNKWGKPALEEVFRIIDRSLESGITLFDTAAAYGEAEEVLGRYIKSRGPGHGLRIISKLRPGLLAGVNDDSSRIEIIKKEITGSLERLHIEALDGYMLHDPGDFYKDGAVSGLIKCKESGLTAKIGVSVYEAEHALDAVNSGVVDCVQVPFNVLDRRLIKSGFFDSAGKKAVTVYARSAFLQGLLLMDEEEAGKRLAIAVKYIREFDGVIKKYGLTRLEAAFHFVYRNPGVDCVVFGVDNLLQLNQFIDLSQKQAGLDQCLSDLENMFQEVEKEVVSPNLWKRIDSSERR